MQTSGSVLNLSSAIRPGSTNYRADLCHWHFLQEESFSLQRSCIDSDCQLCCFKVSERFRSANEMWSDQEQNKKRPLFLFPVVTAMIDRACLSSKCKLSSCDYYLKRTEFIIYKLGNKWQRDAIKIYKEPAVKSEIGLGDLSRMLTAQANMSGSQSGWPCKWLFHVTDTEEKTNAIGQV